MIKLYGRRSRSQHVRVPLCVSLRKHPFLRALRRWDVSRGGTFTTQRQKFHTVDENQCLHNKSGSHGVPNINLSHFTSLIVDFVTVLCSSANEFQQNSNASSRQVLLSIVSVFTERKYVNKYFFEFSLGNSATLATPISRSNYTSAAYSPSKLFLKYEFQM